MKVAIYTLGCKVNQYETQAMEQTLRAKGHQVVEFSDEADAYVVNTCSVTAVSDQKSRQVIHRVQKQHPAAVVAVCGCYPQTHPEDVRKLGADLIAGTGDREGFVSLLEEAAAGKKNLEAIDKSFERRVFEVLPAGDAAGRRPAPPPVRGAACRRHGGPHPRHAENRGRLRELLHLLYHPLCPGTGAVPAPGTGGGADAAAGSRGLPGDRADRHRDLLLGP